MKKRVLVCMVLVLLLCGCVSNRQRMTDEEILAEAQRFTAALDVGDCEYKIMTSEILVQRYLTWSSAHVPEYPDGMVFTDYKKTYYCTGNMSLTVLLQEGGSILENNPDVREIQDFSFEAYDELAARVLGLIKVGMTQSGMLRTRFNYEYINSEDYLYFDFEEAFLGSEAFVEAVGRRYDEGFMAFHYLEGDRQANICSVILSQYAETGETIRRDYYKFYKAGTWHGFTEG